MTGSIKQSDFDKALALLPWYAKGQLSPDENNWIRIQLKNSKSLQNELHLIKKQISITKAYVDNINVKEFENQKDRLSALQHRINTVAHSDSAVHNKSDKNNLWTKLLSFLPQTQSSWKTAGALALGIMVIQGVVISQLYRKLAGIFPAGVSRGRDCNDGVSEQDVAAECDVRGVAQGLSPGEIVVCSRHFAGSYAIYDTLRTGDWIPEYGCGGCLQIVGTRRDVPPLLADVFRVYDLRHDGRLFD